MRHEIFSTPIWHIEETPQHLVDELYEKALTLKKFHKVKDDEYTRSNEGGYQTEQFDWSTFHPEGIEYINKKVSEEFNHPFKIIGWWYNINPKGSWNRAHNHPGSDFAVVWYLTDSHRCLYFMSPFFQTNKLRGGEPINPNSKKGDILIFPGDIIHYVMPNPTETDRVCISMNLQLS